jgi:rubrerythrin
MTREEAVESLKKRFERRDDTIKENGFELKDSDTAIVYRAEYEAITEEVKPRESTFGTIYFSAECPKCLHGLHKDEHPDYCPNCGVKLNWKE